MPTMNATISSLTYPAAVPKGPSFSSDCHGTGWPRRSRDGESSAALLLEALAVHGADRSYTPLGLPLGSNEHDGFVEALQHYRSQRWEAAFELLASLADADHPQASRLALLMLRYEGSFFLTNFVATPRQVARWAQCVLRSNSRATARPRSMTAMA